jgi:site-specific recombinase XerD
MFQLLDIRFFFFLRTTYANAEGKNPIIFRVTYRGEHKDIFSGLYCHKKCWLNKLRKVDISDPTSALLNSNMELIQHKAIEQYDRLHFGGIDFTIGELVDQIRGKQPPPQTLREYIDLKMDEIQLRIDVDISKSTYKKYKTCILHLCAFLEKQYKVKNVGVPNINIVFVNKFFSYLRIDKNISHNTAMNYMKAFKTFLLPAIQQGVLKNNPFNGFKMTFKKIFVDFLTTQEVELIANLPLMNPSLARVRDQFIFCCYTGLAYVDLQQLNKQNFIEESDGAIYIKIPRQKTGQISIIPLLPAARRILERYCAGNDIKELNWKVSSNQKMNSRLKLFSEKIGLTKPLHMHLARHTFATTITLSNGVPIESVSKMLGHSSIQMTQRYAKVIPAKIKNDMKRVEELYF